MRHRRRSAFARLVFCRWFGSAIFGGGRCPFLLSLQLLVVSRLFSAVALGTLKAIIRFAHQQSPDDFELRPLRPFVNGSPQLPLISSISNPRARAVCASPCGIGELPRPFRALVAPRVSHTSGAVSSRERPPHAAFSSSTHGVRRSRRCHGQRPAWLYPFLTRGGSASPRRALAAARTGQGLD